MNKAMVPIPSEELLKEKSLLDVYFASRCISVSRLNQAITFVSMVLLALYAWFSPEPTHQFADRVRAIADYGFSFATSILSFLIAGFTIYLTVTKIDHLILMASLRHENGLPWVKHIAFSFLRIMAVYVVYCLACIGVKIFASSGGPLAILVDALSGADQVKHCIARIGIVVLGGATIHLVLLLQSFIFNIYNTSVTVLCLDIEKREKAGSNSDGAQE